MAKALDDIRVIEIGHGEGLTLAGRLMAELGAEVIKVEPPQGDIFRKVPPFIGDGKYSYYFEMMNVNKRSVVLDLEKADDIEELKALIDTAEVVIECFPDKPGYLAGKGLDFTHLKLARPDLIYASITGFGKNGPYASRPFTDLTAAAVNGLMYIGGYEEDPPNKMGVAIFEDYAAMNLVAGIMAAICNRDDTNMGNEIECSLADMGFPMQINGTIHLHQSDLCGGHVHHEPFARRGLGHGTAVPYNGYFAKDGDLVFIGAFGEKPWRALCDFMERPDLKVDDPRCCTNAVRLQNREYVDGIVSDWVKKYTAQEVYDMLERDLPVALGHTVDQLFDVEHFKVRDMWRTIKGPYGEITVPNSTFKMEKTPGVVDAPAPALGEAPVASFLNRKPGLTDHPIAQDPSEGPLKGLKIADFTVIVAGSYGTRLMADMGAEVVKIERPGGEMYRTSPPQINDIKGAGVMFNVGNAGKKSAIFNLKLDEAAPAARDIALRADGVFENNAPGNMHKNGALSYDDIKDLREDLIYLSSTGFGNKGPWAHRLAFDAIPQCESGVQSLNGWPGKQPQRLADSGIDMSGPVFALSAFLAAMHYRKRTGIGQYIDMAMSDGGIYLTFSAWPELFTSGKVLTNYANRYPFYAPYNGYMCKDERMVTIGVITDEQWTKLVDLMEDAGRQFKRKYLTVTERLAHNDEIDAAIAAWIGDRSSWEIEKVCLDAGIPAGVAYTLLENLYDPKMADRAMAVHLNHWAGPWICSGTHFKFSNTPAWVHGRVQEPGAYTEIILKDWAGYDDAEIQRLRDLNAINDPNKVDTTDYGSY